MREIKFRAWLKGRKEMAEVDSIHFKGNAENLYYGIYSNLLFETMLIVSRLLNSVERTKKIDF